MNIVVQHNIPIPRTRRSRKYPFAHMKIGDSFLLPTTLNHVNASSAASNFGRTHGMKFIVRYSADEQQHRCWRIA